MGDLFNTLSHWKDNSCVVHCLYSQLRCIRKIAESDADRSITCNGESVKDQEQFGLQFFAKLIVNINLINLLIKLITVCSD